MRLKGGMAAGIPGAPRLWAAAARFGRPQQGTGRPPGGTSFTQDRAATPGWAAVPVALPTFSRFSLAYRRDAYRSPKRRCGDDRLHARQCSEEPKAITLLAGVEAMLTASPNASQAMMISPWSLSSVQGRGRRQPVV